MFVKLEVKKKYESAMSFLCFTVPIKSSDNFLNLHEKEDSDLYFIMVVDAATMVFNGILLHMQNITLDCIAYQCFAMLWMALHCFAMHCIVLHCIALFCNILDWVAVQLHCTGLHSIVMLWIALHGSALDCIAVYWICLVCAVFSCIESYCIV